MKKALKVLAGPLFVLAMFVGALWLLHSELQQYHLRDFVKSLAAIPRHKIWLAVGLTTLNYLVLISYDWLGIRYIRHEMSLGRISLASFLGYAVGNNVGTLFGGSTIRYRLYSSWGLSGIDILKLVLILGVTFWIGLFALAGIAFIVEPVTIPTSLKLPVTTTRPLGIVLSLLAVGYLAICAFHRTPLKIGRWEFSPPPLGLSILQYGVATVDLMVAASVPYVLLPDSVQISYFHFLNIYLLAVVASFISQVPGGLGVMELVLLRLLAPEQPPLVIGSLLAFRAIYYLMPLVLGLGLLGINEVAIHLPKARSALGFLGRWTPVLAPRVIAVSVFAAGVMLLFSGAMPASHGRLDFLRHLLPLPVIEISHFLGSIVGALLLVLARGLQRRVETAYWLTLVMLGAGVVFSLVKGLDYEEAIILGIMLAVLIPCRDEFQRHGAFLTERFSWHWIVSVGIVLACGLWLMLFAFKHVEYRDELWWQFAFHADAPRSLRACVGIVLVLLCVSTIRLLRPKGQKPHLPTPAELEQVRAVVANSPDTASHLALLGDKRFLLNKAGTAFVMYGIEGGSWIAMGDPVGPENEQADLAWDFLEICDAGSAWPVFYQIDHRRVPMYVEMGLELIKLGEEARVPLADFDLEGHAHRNLRRTYRHVTEAGCRLEIVEPPLGDELMSQLARISGDWLASKKAAEKGFSLGFFQPDYIRRGPVALVRRDNDTVAFANVWRGADNEELSLDLMRYRQDAPTSVMEYLFIELMLWGKAEGYAWFNLGMSPLSGMESQRLGPWWNRLAALAYRYGDNFYNFQGLRNYKEKFDPIWTPKYLASPGGLRLPLILTNVATLISGGIKGLVRK